MFTNSLLLAFSRAGHTNAQVLRILRHPPRPRQCRQDDLSRAGQGLVPAQRARAQAQDGANRRPERLDHHPARHVPEALGRGRPALAAQPLAELLLELPRHRLHHRQHRHWRREPRARKRRPPGGVPPGARGRAAALGHGGRAAADPGQQAGPRGLRGDDPHQGGPGEEGHGGRKGREHQRLEGPVHERIDGRRREGSGGLGEDKSAMEQGVTATRHALEVPSPSREPFAGQQQKKNSTIV